MTSPYVGIPARESGQAAARWLKESLEGDASLQHLLLDVRASGATHYDVLTLSARLYVQEWDRVRQEPDGFWQRQPGVLREKVATVMIPYSGGITREHLRSIALRELGECMGAGLVGQEARHTSHARMQDYFQRMIEYEREQRDAVEGKLARAKEALELFGILVDGDAAHD